MQSVKSLTLFIFFLVFNYSIGSEQDTTMVITEEGNVGIGITVPSRIFHIHQTGSTHAYICLTNDFTGSGINDGFQIVTAEDGQARLINRENTSMGFETNNSLRVVIDKDGNLGVGTTSPNSPLEVNGIIHSSSGGIKFPDGTIQTSAATGSGSSFWSASGNDIYNNNSGNVGIGISSPTRLFHIHESSSSHAYISLTNEFTGSGINDGFQIIAAEDGQARLINRENTSMGFETNNTLRAVIDKDGNMGIGNSSPTARVDIENSSGYNQLRLRNSYTPSSSSDSNGNVGDITWDDEYIYVKTNAGWKRASLSTW